MFKKLGDLVKQTQTHIATSLQELEIVDPDEDESPEENFGCLWEESEHVNLCRGCLESFQMPFIKRKHHCRRCGGTFCDECCPKPGEEIRKSGPTKGGGRPSKSGGVRICQGCKRGETPGVAIQELVRAQLEAALKKKKPKDDMEVTLKKVEKIANKVANSLGIQVSDAQPSIPLKLERKKLYDDEKVGTSEAKHPPSSGYFEFTNKSDSVCCIKVLLPGGSRKFEVPRPSYYAGNVSFHLLTLTCFCRINIQCFKFFVFRSVPPGMSVSAEFDSESADTLELILLHNNPHSIPKDQRLVYNTRAKNVKSSGDITDCAKVDLFRDVAVYVIECASRNVILKYKGDEDVLPRRGSALQRVGLFNWMANRRFAEGMIDYNTNVDEVRLDFRCCTS